MPVKLEEYVARLKALRDVRPDGVVHVVGETAESLGACRSCGAVVVWGRMKGRAHPFDVDGASHFSTCAQAAAWRREETPAEPLAEVTTVGAVFVTDVDWPPLHVSAGDRGIVIEAYDGGVTLLFRNGEFCGFSEAELARSCRLIGRISLLYRLASAIALRFDVESRYFDRFFADADKLVDPEARS